MKTLTQRLGRAHQDAVAISKCAAFPFAMGSSGVPVMPNGIVAGLWHGIGMSWPSAVLPRYPDPPLPEPVGSHTLLASDAVTPLRRLPNDLYEYIYKQNGINVVARKHTHRSG